MPLVIMVAEKSKKLLINDRCAAVFGCWTSASRKAVLPVFEKENGLLYYPTFYEGLEQSKNVFYTGQEATQQILYSLDWAQKEKKAKSFFLIGSDYIWPRTSMKSEGGGAQRATSVSTGRSGARVRTSASALSIIRMPMTLTSLAFMTCGRRLAPMSSEATSRRRL